MSLSNLNIVIYDKLTGNIENKDDNPYILVDDSVKIIKEKMFVFGGVKMYPGFLKLEYKNENEYYIYSNNTITNELYISNLITELENDYDVGGLYVKENAEMVEIVEAFKKQYKDLTIDDFYIALKIILLQSNNELYNRFTDDIKEFVSTITRMSSKLKKEYEQLQQVLTKYYTKNLEKIDVNMEIYWKNINLNILPSDYAENKKQFIKMEQIFNIIELDERIPFISVNTIQETPLIKVYNKLLDITTEKEVKSWILNEKKKAQVLTYKIIKGLYIVYKLPIVNELMSVIIRNNGVIICKLASKSNKSLEDIKNIMVSGVDYIIEYINKIPNVFLYSKRLQQTKNSKIRIDSLSGECILTGSKISINKINEVLNNEIIRKNIFEMKDTLSSQLISLYYKKGNEKSITLNIQDNEYARNSSIITVFNIKSEKQIYNIVSHLVSIAGIIDNSNSKLKEKSHIKDLRAKNVKIFSTKCQKPQQPVLYDNTMKNLPLESSYTLEYENNVFVCPNPVYPYPGFRNDNLLCCFKKDQRNKPAYIRNIKNNDKHNGIYVRPSNFKIKIDNRETQLIKIINEYQNETNAIDRYYYINEKLQLIPVKNDKLIEKIENSNDIVWLEEVELSTLISSPPSNKCKFIPIFNSKEDNVDPCGHHKNNKIFGYTDESFPCCFKKEPTEVEKVRDIMKSHIITMDKILDYQRMGVLPDGLVKLFPENYYRMGVVQNNSAFLNAVALANSFNQNLKNDKTFKQYIIKYLLENKSEFETLNDSDIINKYKSIDAYINTLKNNKNVLYWYDFIDVIQRILNINIIILNIPFQLADTNKKIDYRNIKIICNYKLKPNNGKYLVLLKRGNTFEIIVNINKQTNNISYLYDKNVDIINILLDYYKLSCIKEDAHPENYIYTKMEVPSKIISLLEKTPFKIIKQIKNYFNKIDYLLTSNNLLIPIRESGVLKNIESTNIKDITLEPIEKYIKYLPKISKILELKYTIDGITVNTDDKITSFMSSFGQLIPVYNNVNDTAFDILDIKYYQDIFNPMQKPNQQIMYSSAIKNRKDIIFNIKTQLGDKISKNEKIKNYILKIIKSNENKYKKIETIQKIFTKLLPTDNNIDIVFKIIANEIINDNIENLLLNNIILADTFNPDFVIKRDTETVLTNINEIQNWFRIFKNNSNEYDINK